MTTRVFLLLTLALTAIQCAAQPIITPYSWTTIAGQLQLDWVLGNGGYADGMNDHALFGAPTGVAVDSAGNLYVADAYNHVIRKVTPVGANWVVTTLAGLAGSSGWVDGTGNAARFNYPTGVAVDGAGNVYVADRDNHSIRMLTPAGVVSTLAGYPLAGYANGIGSAARFSEPRSVAVDASGNLYVADYDNNMIRKMTLVGTDWQVTTLAGSKNLTGPGAGQGTDPGTQLNNPAAVAVDGAGNVYVADYWSDTIRKVTPDGGVTRWAGHFVVPVFQGHYGNADGTGPEAQFNYPKGLAVDGAGNVYVADTDNSEIRKVTPQGVVTTLGGVPAFDWWGPASGGYQDGAGSTARFFGPMGVAVDNKGNLYVADTGNFVIRKGVAPVVQVVALEVTQVIQDWRNSVPLIAGKATYVRAHLQLPPNSSGPVTVSGARLYGRGVNGPLPGPPMLPINKPDASLTVQTANAADPTIRGHFANSLNFQLPPEWLSGTITLQLAWSGGLEPANVVASDCTVEVTFVPAAVLQVKFFDVPWTDAGGANHYQVGLGLLHDLAQRVLSCYPVASVDATFDTLRLKFTGPPGVEAVNQALGSKRYYDVLSGLLPMHTSVGHRIYHGAIPRTSFKWLGLAAGFHTFVSSSQVWGTSYGAGRQTAAHEIGHNLGRQHDVSQALFGGTSSDAFGACGEPGAPNYVYPLFQPMAGYPNGAATLGPMTLGSNALIYGLDTLTLPNLTAEPVVSCTNMAPMIKDPNCYFDLMSYCHNTGPDPVHPLPYGPEDRWPSIVTYTNLLGSINDTFGPPSPALQAVQAPKGGGGNYLIVRGMVDFNAGTAQFLPCLALSTSNAPPAPPAGTNFLLQALDGSGLLLQAVEFELEPSIVEEGDTSQTADFIVPLTDDPSIRTLRLWYHGVLLAALSASAHAPALTLTTPNGGQNFATGTVSVAWSGSDADGDALAYTVQYTADDGATWETLAVDWPGQSLEIACSELAATTRGRMRVIASDGFNTAAAQSAATFTVQPHAPRVSINSPPDGAIFMADQQLFLDASANDMQDGALKGTNVQWSSNLDGPLGQGAIVTFNAKRLREGYHAITVTAIDSAGLTNSAVTHLLALHYPPPQLSIELTPEVPGWFPPYWTLSWPSYYTNYVLQGSASLASGWAAVTNPAPSGNELSVDVRVGGVKSFFRLVFQP